MLINVLTITSTAEIPHTKNYQLSKWAKIGKHCQIYKYSNVQMSKVKCQTSIRWNFCWNIPPEFLWLFLHLVHHFWIMKEYDWAIPLVKNYALRLFRIMSRGKDCFKAISFEWFHHWNINLQYREHPNCFTRTFLFWLSF